MHAHWTFVILSFLVSSADFLFRLEHVEVEECKAFQPQPSTQTEFRKKRYQAAMRIKLSMFLALKLVSERRADGTICQGQAAWNAVACLLSFFQTSIICLCECFCEYFPPSGSCFLFVFVWRDPRRAGDYTSLKFKSETSMAEYNRESLKKDWFNVEKNRLRPLNYLLAVHKWLPWLISLAPSDLGP